MQTYSTFNFQIPTEKNKPTKTVEWSKLIEFQSTESHLNSPTI